VSVVLLREGDPTFRIVPKAVSGSVGKGKYAGANQTIYWNYKRDIQYEPQGDDYYFEIIVEPIKGSNSLYYTVAGVTIWGIIIYSWTRDGNVN
jgi:hypothetical protein